jgi:hypothetical protein
MPGTPRGRQHSIVETIARPSQRPGLTVKFGNVIGSSADVDAITT